MLIKFNIFRLSKALNRKVTSEAVWAHLKTMYNLKALNQLEPLPFPNEQVIKLFKK